MTYTEAIKYLDSFINYEKLSSYDYKTSFKLDRVRFLLELLGNPQDGIKAIHITGTKGKGSTAAIASSILISAGFKCGLYTSPHLFSFRERIRINGEPISEEEVAALVGEVKNAVEKSKDKEFTFFELYTAAAFLYFKMKKIDIAVIEVGLGGRLDATNVVRSLVSCITPISLEHTRQLGSTIREIAEEKAAIIKENSICISAPQADEALLVISEECRRKKARLYELGKNIFCKSLAADDNKEIFSVFGIFGEYPNLEMRLLGEHQIINAATAVGAIEALRFYDVVISSEAVREGIANARWPGRLEIIGRKPFIVLDGAQNKASANVLKKAIKRLFKYERLILILGFSKDKDISGICEELEEIADEIILTKSKIPRAIDPGALKNYIKNRKTHLTDSVSEAIALSTEISTANDLLLITGSLYVVGEARGALIEGKKEPVLK